MKEIRDYKEAIFFGLSVRQFVCSLLAVGVAVGLYFALRPLIGTEETGWICILGAAPFAACGFFKYHGMTAEQFAWAWFKSEFLYPKKLVFRSDCLYYELILKSDREPHIIFHIEREDASAKNIDKAKKAGPGKI